MTLQTAAQQAFDFLGRVRIWEEGTPDLHDVKKDLRVALADEQAQAVEPVAIYDISVNEKIGAVHLLKQLKSGDKLYTHPTPPPAGERAKVGYSRFESWYSELHQSGKGSKQIVREAYEAGMNEAQQVAVPQAMEDLTGMTMCCGDFAKCHRPCTPRGQWMSTKAYQVTVPAGMAIVPTEALLDIKNRVNTLATLSLKAERYSVGRAIKQDIADMIAAAQGAKP